MLCHLTFICVCHTRKNSLRVDNLVLTSNRQFPSRWYRSIEIQFVSKKAINYLPHFVMYERGGICVLYVKHLHIGMCNFFLLNTVDTVFHMLILLCISTLPEYLCDTKYEILLQDYGFDRSVLDWPLSVLLNRSGPRALLNQRLSLFYPPITTLSRVILREICVL